LEFLGAWLFRFENPDLGGCFSLDFLGFSRAKRDLSMGYTGFSLKNFSWPFCPLGVRGGGTEGRRRSDADAQKWSSSKLNLDSDFVQYFVETAVFRSASTATNSV
jgi:hypothetical protein